MRTHYRIIGKKLYLVAEDDITLTEVTTLTEGMDVATELRKYLEAHPEIKNVTPPAVITSTPKKRGRKKQGG